MRVNRRAMLLSGLSAMLGGCGANEAPRIANSLIDAILPPEQKPFDRSVVATIPYACLQAKVGDGPLSLVILGGVDGADLTWFSADKAALVTRGGRVLRTAGFPSNLRRTQINGPDPIAAAWSSGKDRDVASRVVDMDVADLYGVIIASEFRYIGPETVTILGDDIRTLHIVESCRCRGLDWEFENHFWQDAGTGMVRRSTQLFMPTIPPLYIDVLRPYG